eukprot:TRINITY_DN32400_c0_g1_i1.p1 TRINITY_DN32400_c0_g1~~TRINITY_DN32400_c0_g1_i1.p1  ORF type:complete len:499 (-),score=131.20 TRINITY_DN32400_c0_g1_i1:19-1515(-)
MVGASHASRTTDDAPAAALPGVQNGTTTAAASRGSAERNVDEAISAVPSAGDDDAKALPRQLSSKAPERSDSGKEVLQGASRSPSATSLQSGGVLAPVVPSQAGAWSSEKAMSSASLGTPKARLSLTSATSPATTPFLSEAESCVSASSDIGGGGGHVGLLSSESSSSRRAEAYYERKRERKRMREAAHGQMSVLNTAGYLSNVPEVDRDIEYRFAFLLSGVVADLVIRQICNSESAAAVGALSSSGALRRGFSESPSARRGGKRDGCLCTVPFQDAAAIVASSSSTAAPATEGEGELSATPRKAQTKVKLAKLMFSCAKNATEVPHCKTRFEALSSAFIYTLLLNPGDDEEMLVEQLGNFDIAVDGLRGPKRHLRTTRAVLLLTRGEPASSGDGRDWKTLLDEFELVHDGLWKLGPIRVEDSEGLYKALAGVASSRLLRAQESNGCDSDGSHSSLCPPTWQAEREDDDDAFWSLPTQIPSGNNFRHEWLSELERGAA